MPFERYPGRVGLAVIFAVALSLMGFALAVGLIRSHSNARAATESVGYVSERLDAERRSLSEAATDFNFWNDALRAIRVRDTAWLYENYAGSAITGAIFDGLVLMGGSLEAPIAWRATEPREEPSPSFIKEDILAQIAAGAEGLPLGHRVSYDTALSFNGRLSLVSAMRTQPNFGEDTMLRPDEHPVSVMVKTLGNDELTGLAKSLFLESLTFVPAPFREPGPGLALLPVVGPDGRHVGLLVWPPPRPGSDVVQTMTPVLLAASLAFVGLGGSAAWLARAHARQILRQRADAERMARTDNLTGLPNRLAFREHLSTIDAQERAQAGVLFMDLDGFKAVNDTIGHAGGDALIASVARRLQQLADEGSFLSRISGDEFVFVLSGAEGVALRAGALGGAVMAMIAEPFDVLGHSIKVSLSQGLAVRNSPDTSMEALVREADQAMYHAKRRMNRSGQRGPLGATELLAAKDAGCSDAPVLSQDRTALIN